MNTKTIHDTRAKHVTLAVRDQITDSAIREVRARATAAGGNWSRLRGGCWAAIREYLETAEAMHVIQYHAAAQTMPGRWRGRASEAMRNAVRRAVRAIGPQLPYLAQTRALDIVVEALGEADPEMVKMLRARNRPEGA